MSVAQIVIGAFLVESVWETLKMVWQNNKASADRIGALVVGVTVGVAYRIDILAYFKLETSWTWLGFVLTGILISRGGNFVHDLFGAMAKLFEGLKAS